MLGRWLLAGLLAQSRYITTYAYAEPEGPESDGLKTDQDTLQRRHDDHERILQKLQRQQPIGMRKMSDDEGEMFFLDYWTFDPLGSRAGAISDVDGMSGLGNSTHSYLNPPLSPHSPSSDSRSALRLARSIFKRDFECPVGTFACTSINQPNSCCSSGETCISVQDTGLGPVGCCPQGQNCGGSVAGCNTDEGFSSCPGSPNGGCCIPGYQCQGVGCIRIGTEILTSRPVTTVNPATTSQVTSVQTVTTTVVISPSTSAAPTTVTQTLIISPSSTSIPSTTASAVAPVRPTSNSNTGSAAPSPSTTSAPANAGCPTAFYRCSAYYVGGCCRVGRDCASTSCPVGSSTTVVGNGDRTIVAPAGATTAALVGNCQSGWATCAASVGGGCCPSGFVCGAADCTATASGQANVGKEAPNTATRLAGLEWTIFILAVVSGVGMVLL
ncbi:hypothetical protein BDZ85DRAFT_261887 [Elsinoe ampelina]|uniref:GPI anchored protein n=1 Tax=Elsinoe ampelina TaxID=302913 RepID=A0A6A6GD47_9PEZI|nr:hypothetical protein BDZ85DRAFT_261887 [Elsinoe ampelina]